MKKYFMIIVTIFMLVLTTAVYIYENNVQAPKINQPSISLESQRFGLIKRIIWTNKYMNDNKALIILSARNSDQGVLSCLYRLNVDTGKSDLLAEFPAHKNLKDVVLFDSPTGLNLNSIIAAYDKGIVKVNYRTDNPSSSSQEIIEIAGFDTATSMDFKGNLVYTRENDKMLYVKNLAMGSFTGFFNNNNVRDLTTYYTRPFYISNLNSLNNIISYTSVNKNRIDLFAMRDGAPVTKLNTPIIKNVVSVRGIEDSFGFAGMNILNSSENNKKLNLFMLRQIIDKYNNADDYYSLDTIPYNTDPFGAVPALDSTTFNQEFTLAYTSYDENHKGSLKIRSLNEQPKVIVSGENIFGPISMTELHLEYGTPLILYFTLENNNVRIKICNGKGDLVKDITDMIMKNN